MLSDNLLVVLLLVADGEGVEGNHYKLKIEN
jgi:hypothetical protein